jgi:hypothetical protein
MPFAWQRWVLSIWTDGESFSEIGVSASHHPGHPAPVSTPISEAQKRQSLKEALPMGSVSGSGMFRLLRSIQLGMVSVAFGIEALPLSQTLQVAYLLMFATQLLM